MALLTEDTPQHALRKNHTKTFPVKILYLDTETKHNQGDGYEKHRLKLAWTCYVERRPSLPADTELWKKWTKPYPFCRHIESLTHDKTLLYIFAHNIFFDLQASDFFYYFTKWGWELDFIYDSGTTYCLVIHKGKKTIKALSTTNFYNTTVKKLGVMLNHPKLDIDFNTTDDMALSAYCKRDVEIIKKAMENYFMFIKQYDLGRFTMTRASQAFTAYRHRFMDRKIYIHSNKKVQELEQSAYIGGRVECFYLGKVPGGPFVSLDINSMYPYIMKHCFVPVRLLDYRVNVPLDIVEESLLYRCGIADVVINTDVPIYPVRSNGKIVFPIGTIRTSLCTPELQEALKRGHITHVYSYASYEKAVIFRDYVDFFYALRMQYKKDDDFIHQELCKNFLNYLYGKFGQYRPLTDETKDKTCDGYYRMETIDLVTGKKEIEYKLFNTVVRTKGREVASSSLLALAAHITAYARLYLWNIIEGVGYDRVLYCDTDSIKLRKDNLKYLKHNIDQHELGALKVEGEFEEFEIYGPKSYRTEHVQRLKGIPQSARKIGDNMFEYMSFLKQATHMRKEVMRYYMIKPTVKVLNPHYDKGVVMPSGWIRPLNF